MLDMFEHEIKDGDIVVRANRNWKGRLEVCEARIENGRLYLDSSKVPVAYPELLLVVTKVFR